MRLDLSRKDISKNYFQVKRSNGTKFLCPKLQEFLNSEILLTQNPPNSASFDFSIINKILKSLTISILYLNIICLTSEIQEK